MSVSEDDDRLIARLRMGDRDAFDKIYRKYAAELFRYVADRVSGREDCERIVQDTFVRIWKQRTALSELRPDLYNALRFYIFRYIANAPDIEKYLEHFSKYFDGTNDAESDEANL